MPANRLSFGLGLLSNVKECNCGVRCSFANVSFIVDCEWQPARTDNDCQRQIEREFNGTDSCYHLTAVDGLTNDETMAVLEEVQARMKDKELYGYKDDVDDPKSLQKRLGACRGGENRISYIWVSFCRTGKMIKLCLKKIFFAASL